MSVAKVRKKVRKSNQKTTMPVRASIPQVVSSSSASRSAHFCLATWKLSCIFEKGNTSEKE